ncbi:hypothetical protein [Mycobacterium sp. M23085]|uniref:hypothetical protein n=1 Tax=Mycobacterium sp. M23085 TaxID=3378087 RepID=UPI003877D371
MLYYANGGPGPASKLLRVDAPEGGDFAAWRCAPAQRWRVKGGWKPDDEAQHKILMTGDFFMIDESQVAQVQEEMRADYARFH